MQLELFGYTVKILVAKSYVGDPMSWSLRGQRMLAHSIAKAICDGGYEYDGRRFKVSDCKIGRIKACRGLAQRYGDTGLREAKDFVEYAFADGGKENRIII